VLLLPCLLLGSDRVCWWRLCSLFQVFWDVVGSSSNSGWRGTFYFVFVFFVSLAGLSPCLANYKPKVYSSFSSLMNDRAPAEFSKNVMSNTKKKTLLNQPTNCQCCLITAAMVSSAAQLTSLAWDPVVELDTKCRGFD
jgi:hypothetical protein